MTAQELREKYLSFFESKGHKRIPSASLVPENDPTVLFTTAGMHPLVPYLLGERHPEGRRLTDVQKCVRTGDIDEVGDPTHLTFFEMLGNWSLQDYFKKEAIAWSYEFLTRELGIPTERLAMSVFAGDDDAPFDEEAFNLWRAQGIPETRIAKLGKKDNWWGPAGQTGPCGPDTEMFHWVGDEPAPERFDPKDDRWVEIWNDVFMQYNKKEDGTFEKLARPNVDTGMGLERVLAVLNGFGSVYDTELFTPVIRAIEVETSRAYGASQDTNRSMRIVADHIRSAAMMISDGVLPSNKDQGYILRRLIRRAARQMLTLGVDAPDLSTIVQASVRTLMDAYPVLVETEGEIIEAVLSETSKFNKTLKKGLREFEKMYASAGHVGGEEAFTLYATYGFPLELTEELVREKGAGVDRETFASEFQKHQNLSRSGAQQKFAGGLADHSEESKRLHTATHLLHQALRTVLGNHVEQRGSNITAERLRFDFSHDEKMTDEEKREVERMVNTVIEQNLPVRFEVLSVEEAKRRGAIGLFEDKYAQLGGNVKVYFVGEEGKEFSKEVCGGPHVEHTSELGHFTLTKEEASSAGVRRIKAVLG
ncbi:MAG: Alanine-tRNA ligase [Parcubacteria group bacterium GW2011_GWA2_56_7]|nr:MAG: Alanine-tRNA ligase [Parcubacteria group bacterium GW2011_GWA2_56_7]